MKPMIAIIALAFLAGCTPRMSYQDKCIEFGFTEGTTEFAQCVQDQYLLDRRASLAYTLGYGI